MPDEVFFRKPSFFKRADDIRPYGVCVDFLQLVAEKTEEGLQATRSAASLVQREVAFAKQMTEGL